MPTPAKQLKRVRAEMEQRPAKLVQHVLRVRDEALRLAADWDVDPVRTELAVWGHDLFRAHRPAELLRLAREFALLVGPEDEASPVMLHGPLAAVVLDERFGVSDPDVLAGVRLHTFGLGEMPMLAKIILLADKVEERKRKRAPQTADIRRLARRDLDLALLCWADLKWIEERTRGWASYTPHWQARQVWVAEHHFEVGLPARTPDEGRD